MSNKAVYIFLILLIFFSFDEKSKAQTTVCQSLDIDKNDYYAYKKRGERCEGRYNKKLSYSSPNNGAISLLGYYTERTSNISISDLESINILLNSKSESAIDLQINSHPENPISYRLDYTTEKKNYLFKTTIVNALNLQFEEIDFKAIQHHDKYGNVIIPLQLNYTSGNVTEEEVPNFHILFLETIDKLILELYSLESNERIYSNTIDRYFPGGISEKINPKEFIENLNSGYYRLELFGEFKDDRFSTGFPFYVP